MFAFFGGDDPVYTLMCEDDALKNHLKNSRPQQFNLYAWTTGFSCF